MTWNPKVELTKKAVEIAKEKHPAGFNKEQLIEASKEVYGGGAVNPSKPIKTMEDIFNMGNAMSEIDGHYPRVMSGCEVVGLNGGCGSGCPVFQSGDCEHVDKEVIKEFNESDDFSYKEKIDISEYYGLSDLITPEVSP